MVLNLYFIYGITEVRALPIQYWFAQVGGILEKTHLCGRNFLANVDNIKELYSIITMKRLSNIREVMFENCVLKNMLALKKNNVVKSE